MILLSQTSRDIENIYRNVGEYDMKYDEFKQICKSSWEEEYEYLCTDSSKKRDQGRHSTCIENKDT